MSEKIIKFINLIENKECLYKSNLADYSNKDITERAWSSIAQEMNWTVTYCKEKWRNIRNGFVRSIKPSPIGTSSLKKKYYLHDVMEFVLPYVKPLQHAEQIGNISEFNDHSSEAADAVEEEISDVVYEAPNSIEDIASFSMERNKKRKTSAVEHDAIEEAFLSYINENKVKDEDPRQLFLLSLLPDLKELSDRQFRQFKIKSLILIEDLIKDQEQNAADELMFQSAQSIASRLVSAPVPSGNYPPATTSIMTIKTEDHTYGDI